MLSEEKFLMMDQTLKQLVGHRIQGFSVDNTDPLKLRVKIAICHERALTFELSDYIIVDLPDNLVKE